jgi:hypothetical protein
MGGHKCGKPCKAHGGTQAGARGHAEGGPHGGAHGGTAGNQKSAWDEAYHVAQVEVPALLLAQASIELSPVASAGAAHLHLDGTIAHTLLGDSSSNDKTDEWCLNIGTTHHMTSRWEFFTELDSDVRGSIRFGDASSVEIKGVGSVFFATESSEHRLLLGVYYIPALRNSIISLG